MELETHMNLSEDEIKNPPTILHILNEIAKEEEKWRTDERWSIFSNFGVEDKFEPILQSESAYYYLEPTKANHFKYFRGQNKDYPKCLSSIYRDDQEDTISHFIKMIKQAEFELLIKNHPFYEIFEKGLIIENYNNNKPIKLNIDPVGLAQHYELETNLLDFSSDKWVAAFFAVCEKKNGIYIPKRTEGYGVFYIYQDFGMLLKQFGTKRVFKPIGLQPFSRPAEQKAYALEMKKGEDLNNYPDVVKHLFRHDQLAGEIIYNRMNQGNILFPEDPLVELAEKIKSAFEFSSTAFSIAMQRCEITEEDKLIKELTKKGFKFRNYQLYKFSKQEIMNFKKKWKKEGEKMFLDKIVYRKTYSL